MLAVDSVAWVPSPELALGLGRCLCFHPSHDRCWNDFLFGRRFELRPQLLGVYRTVDSVDLGSVVGAG